MLHSPGGRQVCPDQTKTVNGQNDKTLATTGAIKWLLPCPVEEKGKQSIFYGVKRKKQSKKKRKKKDKKENREEKKGN